MDGVKEMFYFFLNRFRSENDSIQKKKNFLAIDSKNVKIGWGQES